jgi:hypothetical protein
VKTPDLSWIEFGNGYTPRRDIEKFMSGNMRDTGVEAMGWTFKMCQLFNEFGAPGIPNTYRATLYQDRLPVEERDFWFRSRAERQCKRWVDLYGATPHQQIGA